MTRRGERGFTLIELVLALTIVAVMLTILFGGLRVSLRAWQRGEERAETLQHARSMTHLLEQSLSGIYPFRGKLEKDSAEVIIFFRGETGRLSFVTVSPPVPFSAPIAFTAVTFAMDAGRSPGLAIREKVLPNWNPFEEVATTLIDPTITAARFRYLRDGDAGSWEESWDAADERTLPQAVEVTLTAMINGRVVEQAPMTVPIRVNTP